MRVTSALLGCGVAGACKTCEETRVFKIFKTARTRAVEERDLRSMPQPNLCVMQVCTPSGAAAAASTRKP